MEDVTRNSRARGCLLGQLAGDALGSLVEFQTPEKIRSRYPDGVRDLADGGTWDTIAGQPTDDSEMALLLARMLIKKRTYDPAAGLRRHPDHASQANGALMRISPLGIFGAGQPAETVAAWAGQDAALTHPHPVCRQANALFAAAIAHAIAAGCGAAALYEKITGWAEDWAVDPALRSAVRGAAGSPPENYVRQQGWVIITFRNALWQLCRAAGPEAGVTDTVMRGGDTDTNSAVCGALLGAVYGLDAIPAQWTERVLGCRPRAGDPGVRRPRPECFWPADALELADGLLRAGCRTAPAGLPGKWTRMLRFLFRSGRPPSSRQR